MNKELSDKIKGKIKEVIETILFEVELEGKDSKNEVYIAISYKKFEGLSELMSIVDRINEGEKNKILDLDYKDDYDEKLNLLAGTAFAYGNLTSKKPENVGVGWHPSFTIYDLERLKEINSTLNKKSAPKDRRYLNPTQIILEKKGLKRTDENKKERFYPIDRTSDRFAVFEASFNGPQRPKDIEMRGKKSVASVKTDINKTAEKLLGLPKKYKLIINDGDGYKINDRYEITSLEAQ